MPADQPDRYATPKSNLRDTAKWMATTFAALAGVVMAGAPFSKFGELPCTEGRFWVAAVGLLFAAAPLIYAWRILTTLLIPDPIYPTQLHSGYQSAVLNNSKDAAEIEAIRKDLDENRRNFLPEGTETFEGLFATAGDLWTRVQDPNLNKDQRETVQRQYDDHRKQLEAIVSYAAYLRLHYRLKMSIPHVMWAGLVALGFLAMFVYAANPPKETKDKPPIVVNCNSQQPCPPPRPVSPTSKVVGSVLFVFNEAKITPEGYKEINKAKDKLREDLRTGLLLSAHTDTRGGAVRNRELARLRSEAVRNAFVNEGGFAANRVFVSDLPKSDLGVITPDQVKSDVNRSVVMVLVQLPDGKDAAGAAR